MGRLRNAVGVWLVNRLSSWSVVVEPPRERTVSWRSQHDGVTGVELEYSRQPLAVHSMSLRGRAGIQPLSRDLIGIHIGAMTLIVMCAQAVC